MDETMTKTAARDALSAYLDGELPPEEVARIEALLAEDEELASELEALRGIVSDLGSLPEIQAPEGFVAAVMARVDEGATVVDYEAERRRLAAVREAADPDDVPVPLAASASPRWWLKGPLIVAAAALLVIGVGRLMVAPTEGPPSMMAAAPRASSGPSLSAAPSPTGGGDSPRPSDEPPLGLSESAPDVAVGFAGSPSSRPASPAAAAAKPATRRRSGITVAPESSRPEGIYAADYELADAEPAAAGEGAASSDASAPAAPASASPAPGAPGLPTANEVVVAEASSVDDEASSSPVGAESAEPPGPVAGTLQVSRVDAMKSLESAVRARGWTLRHLGTKSQSMEFDAAHKSRTVEVAAQASEAEVRTLLAAHGSVGPGSYGPGADGVVRLRLTVVYVAK